MEISIRNLKDIEDFEKVQQLDLKIWGADPVPTHQTMTAAKNGGFVIGAFDGETCIGFQYSFAGFKDGEAYVCSHMMGIDPDYRNQGIGYRLKQEQAKIASELGYKKIRWTYDPLESRNGYLNLAKLGAICSDYVENCYGEMKDGLNAGMPSDRFNVEWYIDHPYLEERRSWFVELEVTPEGLALDWQQRPDGLPQAVEARNKDYSDVPYLFVPIPVDNHGLKKQNPELALDWRYKTREVFVSLFSQGWAACHVIRKKDEPCEYYVLCRRDELI
ncbi:GNAT family N-acetyltransferase [Niallia sp. Krafla_26]|uniref:GNAT family N-acetyltransferase n=1 Tax=Niallia sp. Krafla_26 TaxID=3064703 RepID=UPI003D17B2E4